MFIGIKLFGILSAQSIRNKRIKVVKFYKERAKLHAFKDRQVKLQLGRFCNCGGCNLAEGSLFQVFFAAFFMVA